MGIFAAAENELAGWPDDLVTVALVFLCLFGLLVAISAPAWFKVAVLTWFVLP